MSTNFELNRDFYWRALTLMCITCMVFIVAESAFAGAATASGDVIGATLCRLTTTLTGGIAKSIATIAIFTVGIGLFMGKVNWGVAAMTAAGVGIIFGAGSIMNMINPGMNSNCSIVG